MTASELKASILDQAIRGKLVPQDPTDEPAGELLKRIAAEKAKLPMQGRGRTQAAPSPITDDEKPFDIPERWVWCRLGELLTNRDGERVPLSLAERSKHQNKKYDYYGASGVIDKVEGYLFDKPLLLIGEDGANLLTRNTPIAFIAQSGKYWVNNHAHVLDCSVFEVLRYVEVYINAISLAPYVTGTAQPKMNQEKMNSIPIPLPPLAEQKRIVAKIEELMSLVERYGKAEARRRELVASLPADLKKSILQEAIQGKLVSQDPNDEPASELLKRIAAERAKQATKGRGRTPAVPSPITDDEKPFEIPDGWSWCRLGALGAFYGGHTPSMADSSLWGDEYLWISSKDMKTKYITDTGDKLSQKGCDELRLLPVDTLIFTTRSGILKHTFPVAILKRESTINQDQRALELYCPEIVEYVYLAIKGQEPHIIQNLTKRGTTVQSIFWEDFVNLPIPVPPLAEQKRIVEKVKTLLAVVDAMKGL